jgi:arachidonate 15-lipoxygenase
MLRWWLRKAFWDFLAWVKMSLNKPLVIPLPPAQRKTIVPQEMVAVMPAVPLKGVLVCPPADIPRDEYDKAKTLVYRFQVWLYTAYPPMQPGLPPIDTDGPTALKTAYTWLHRTRYRAPLLPAEYLGSADLGSLAVRGPYACYTARQPDGRYAWDLRSLAGYQRHEGLHDLALVVHFEIDERRRALQAVRIDCTLGEIGPQDARWELAKRLALCAATTHLSLVRHFNWVHLAGGSALATATRNRLPASHPLCRLLWPYIYATHQSNHIVTRGQMARGGEFETIFSYTFEGMCKLFEDSWRAYPHIVNDPERDGAARGVRHAGFDTPTQDNLEALFAVMHQHAQRYVALYVVDEAALQADADVAAWLDELNILTPGGVGLTRDALTRETLARLLAQCMYIVTVQHEILGSALWDYQLWTHRQPVRVALDGSREPLDVYQRLVNANYNLNVTRLALMHDFSKLALDGRGAAEMQRFQIELAELQAAMSRSPWALWRLAPKTLKVNMNA